MIDRDTKETESPAPAPVCARCNGTGIRSWHPEPGITEQTECDECDTVMDGLPAAEPEPAPLDPVLVGFVAKWIADHAESSVCNWDDCVEENQRDYRSYAESAIAAIRAYRKDGAR